VRIASVHASNLRRVRALGYEGETALAQTEVARLVSQPLSLLRRSPPGGQAAQVPLNVGPIRLDRPEFVHKCHALGLRVDYWTINDAATARRLLALGADGIMTDDPKLVAPVVRAYRGER
jgi:glycerophosphoryl diester phosphodiesterase